jgi:hypothetical protein
MQTEKRERDRTTQNWQLLNQRTLLPYLQLEHELLTLINKKVATLGSYWHNKDLIGVGLWFCHRVREQSKDRGPQPDEEGEELQQRRSSKELVLSNMITYF